MPSRRQSIALLKRTELLAGAATIGALPRTIADLGGFELTADCDRCGRHLRLHPGPTELGLRTRLVSLLKQLTCSARRNGSACAGRPRRLILTRDDRRWCLDHSGLWSEDQGAVWEDADFEALAAGTRVPQQWTALAAE